MSDEKLLQKYKEAMIECGCKEMGYPHCETFGCTDIEILISIIEKKDEKVSKLMGMFIEAGEQGHKLLKELDEEEDKIDYITAQVIELLVDKGMIFDDLELRELKKPTHGLCCTCQDCGYHHEDCVCDHNEILLRLYDIFGEDRLNKFREGGE